MPVALILPLVTAALQAAVEFLRFLSTPEGQLTVAKWRADDTEFRKAAADAGGWLKRLLSGQILAIKKNTLGLDEFSP